jgi:hypothetical protein
MPQIFFDETFVLICFSFTFSLPTKEAKSEFVLRTSPLCATRKGHCAAVMLMPCRSTQGTYPFLLCSSSTLMMVPSLRRGIDGVPWSRVMIGRNVGDCSATLKIAAREGVLDALFFFLFCFSLTLGSRDVTPAMFFARQEERRPAARASTFQNVGVWQNTSSTPRSPMYVVASPCCVSSSACAAVRW